MFSIPWQGVAALCAVVALAVGCLAAFLRIMFRAELAELVLRLDQRYVRRAESHRAENSPASAGAD